MAATEKIDRMSEITDMMLGTHPVGFLCWVAVKRGKTVVGYWDWDNCEVKSAETVLSFEAIVEKFPLSLIRVMPTPRQPFCEMLRGASKVAINIDVIHYVELLPRNQMEIQVYDYAIRAHTII